MPNLSPSDMLGHLVSPPSEKSLASSASPIELEPPFRQNWRRLRPGFMTMTVAIAGAISLGATLLANHMAGEGYGDSPDERADWELRQTMSSRGWLPAGGGSAPALNLATLLLGAEQGLEVLRAERPFRLALLEGELAGGAAGEAQVSSLLGTLAEELRRYPPGLFRRARFRRILFCGGLRQAGQPITSLPNLEQTLLIDASASAQFLRRLVHHEVFHFMDYSDDDQLKRDPAWEKLNQPDFSYGSGGRFLRDPAASEWSEEQPGFLSRYAASAVEEDKAELFSFMMTAPQAVKRRISVDSVLRAKVGAIENQLMGRFLTLRPGFWRGADGLSGFHR